MDERELARLRQAVNAEPMPPEPRQIQPYVGMIRILREQRHWSIAQLAKRCGLHPVRLGSYERGDRQPSAAVLGEIFDALDHEFRVVPKSTPKDEVDPGAMAATLRRIADQIEDGRG